MGITAAPVHLTTLQRPPPPAPPCPPCPQPPPSPHTPTCKRLLRVQRVGHGVGEAVVHRASQAGAVGVPNPGDLDGRWAQGQRAQPVGRGMPGQLYKDVDAVGPYQLGQLCSSSDRQQQQWGAL